MNNATCTDKPEVVKTITLWATNGQAVELQAVDDGRWHPPTATSDAHGHLALRLQSRFWSRTFQHQILGKHAVEILTQMDNRAPECEPHAGAFIELITAAIVAHRNTGIALAKGLTGIFTRQGYQPA